ncbi:hypothetical protein QBC46DRAFT_362237 [Diplogelasinospora grovesii]|uniref:Meiotic recombination protein DMC1 n=1 Tax=Diplogelasinospora grovesii TaxID=303347 RepID=A0AAN6NFL3_9PEZI|nr:hypothetical protein QBC46DRAFT_362237 [Diplogelasinospora grovesii]
MADTTSSPNPAGSSAGGFVIPSLPSPAPSNATNASTRSLSGLPHPRGSPLRPGSAKEDKVRNYVSDRMLHISRRYVKKFALVEPDDEVVGYRSMGELCRDLEPLINIIWKSGTPGLQVPLLLNIASEFNTWLSSFAPSPTATFSILRKLDHCFASLLTGQDIETKEPLPGFERGPQRSGMTTTDKVRCKGIIEATRVLIVEVMSKEPDQEGEEDDEPGILTADESESGPDGPSRRGIWEEDDERLHMDVARVYENTIVQLGESLGDGWGVVSQMSEN